MPSQIILLIVTSVLGLLTAGILALVNNWITARSGIDENLRNQRLKLYPALWASTSLVSWWPPGDPTRASLSDLRNSMRLWYYGEGGMFLSTRGKARYNEFQELIAALLAHSGHSDDRPTNQSYIDLRDTASALRTALTEDLDTRRRKSMLERGRRTIWHHRAARSAKKRIERAGKPPCAWSKLRPI
jgi:hypothetical protein